MIAVSIEDPKVKALITAEENRQETGIELIASENFTSRQVMAAMGTALTNKYAEGLPGKRYYGGCEVVDEIETLAIERAKEMFGAAYANVQPHSGAQANAAVMLACIKPGDKILGFDLSHGGHLTHGSKVNFSGMLYDPVFYGVTKTTGRIDWEEVVAIAQREKPKLIIAGASAYSRDWDYQRLREVADEIGALLMADISHPAGLIAAGLLNDPLPHCHIVTTTTHKTLRGPRGGLILMGKDFENPWGLKTPKGNIKMMSNLLNMAVFLGTQGGSLEHVIAAKAIAFGEVLSPTYKTYAQQVIKNAQVMSDALIEFGYEIISGGTDNHLCLIDLRNKDITGKAAEIGLGKADITVNKNMVPFDDQSPFITSGIRLGTAAVTTRGMKEADIRTMCGLINEVLTNIHDDQKLAEIKAQVNQWMGNFPLYIDQAVVQASQVEP